jgi:hypothetical protein
MKFATFEHDGRRRVGLLEPGTDVLRPVDATDMVDLITRFETLVPSLSSIGPAIPLPEVRLVAPIPEPRRNIFASERTTGNTPPNFPGAAMKRARGPAASRTNLLQYLPSRLAA